MSDLRYEAMKMAMENRKITQADLVCLHWVDSGFGLEVANLERRLKKLVNEHNTTPYPYHIGYN